MVCPAAGLTSTDGSPMMRRGRGAPSHRWIADDGGGGGDVLVAIFVGRPPYVTLPFGDIGNHVDLHARRKHGGRNGRTELRVELRVAAANLIGRRDCRAVA